MAALKLSYLRTLSDEELFKISLEKGTKGRYSSNANKAMQVILERSNMYYDISSNPPSAIAQVMEYDGDSNKYRFTKKFK